MAGATDPEWGVPFFHIGNSYYDAGDAGSAVTAYTEAIERDPQFREAQYNRGNARYQMGDYRGAFEDFLAVYTMEPDNADALYNLGASAIALAEEMRDGGAPAEGTTSQSGDEPNAETQNE
jgi:tetratricopeptide (TPR) repeat protein